MPDTRVPRWNGEDLTKRSNEELAWLARDNALESHAYFELWRRTRGMVNRIVCGRIYGLDAEHAVTEFYCHKLPGALQKFTPQNRTGAFQAWLLRVLKNYLYDHFRRNKTQRDRQISLENISNHATSLKSSVEEQHEKEHMVYFLHAILKQVLGPEDRYIFRARYWEDKTLKEIAEELGCSHESVRVRHWRARQRLHRACKIYRESGLL